MINQSFKGIIYQKISLNKRFKKKENNKFTYLQKRKFLYQKNKNKAYKALYIHKISIFFPNKVFQNKTFSKNNTA